MGVFRLLQIAKISKTYCKHGTWINSTKNCHLFFNLIFGSNISLTSKTILFGQPEVESLPHQSISLAKAFVRMRAPAVGCIRDGPKYATLWQHIKELSPHRIPYWEKTAYQVLITAHYNLTIIQVLYEK